MQNTKKKIRFYREDRRSQALSDAQTRKIIQISKEISTKPGSLLQRCFHDMVILAINTGMRKSEILNLKWKDIKGEEIEVIGKGDKRRIVPLNLHAKAIIERQPKKNGYFFRYPEQTST